MKNIIFETKEQYLNAIAAWKETCKNKDFHFQAEHFALYAIIRDKNPEKCFASPEQQSQRKLQAQGSAGWGSYNSAMSYIKNDYYYAADAGLLAPFKGTLTKIQLLQMRDIWKAEDQREEVKQDRIKDLEWSDEKLQRLGAM